jgi:cbb3-type cytochrome oxidase maturation protein
MSVILILILTSLAVAGGFLAAFIWAVRSGQYEDTQTPSMRILMDEEARPDFAERSGGSAERRQSNFPAPSGRLSAEPPLRS